MSFLKGIEVHHPIDVPPIKTVHSKLEASDDVVDGILVKRYSFTYVDRSSEPTVHYSALCIGNLKALGQLNNLKSTSLQRNDVDLVIDSLENSLKHEPAQTPTEDKKA